MTGIEDLAALQRNGSEPVDLIAEVSTQLDLGGDPIAAIKRWGRHEDSRLVITLKSGQRIVFDRARDVFEPAIVKRRVVLATDGNASPKTLKKPAAEDLAVKIVRLANIAQAVDDRDEARDWAGTFLEGREANTVDVGDYSTPEGRWETLCIFGVHKATVVVRDVASGALLVRVSDMASHVRAMLGTGIGWEILHSRLSEVGWRHLGEVQQRQPRGPLKRKTHLHAVTPEGGDEDAS
jgi:hypothetical protein